MDASELIRAVMREVVSGGGRLSTAVHVQDKDGQHLEIKAVKWHDGSDTVDSCIELTLE